MSKKWEKLTISICGLGFFSDIFCPFPILKRFRRRERASWAHSPSKRQWACPGQDDRMVRTSLDHVLSRCSAHFSAEHRGTRATRFETKSTEKASTSTPTTKRNANPMGERFPWQEQRWAVRLTTGKLKKNFFPAPIYKLSKKSNPYQKFVTSTGC